MSKITTSPDTEEQSTSFENVVSQLEAVLDRLQNGDPALGDSLELFAKAMMLIQDAQRYLADAEQTVSTILEAKGESTRATQDQEI